MKKIDMLLRHVITNFGRVGVERDGWEILDPRDGAPLTDEVFQEEKEAKKWIREHEGNAVKD